MASGSQASVKVGILSVGDMGVGIARLLVANGFLVATNCTGRSAETTERAQNAGVELLSSDTELVQQCELILSIVPPGEAEATARRVAAALSASPKTEGLFYADLNAVSPMTVKNIASVFEKDKLPVRFFDGSILGHPPTRKAAGPASADNIATSDDSDSQWSRPRIPVCGPYGLDSLPASNGKSVADALNFRHISPELGAASGLKMCFAAMSKGVTAIATQSFATAHSLGVADELEKELTQLMPAHLTQATKGVPGMPPKAYRWVREMEEIAATMSEVGGWSPAIFQGAASVYREVAANNVLSQERVGKRKRGTTVGDVAQIMAEGLEKKRKKDV